MPMVLRALDVPSSELFRPRQRWGSIIDRLDIGDCWEWTGYKSAKGYGAVSYPSNVRGKTHAVHRVVWAALVGPLNPGDSLDHLCRNPACANPDHLELIDIKANILRGFNPPAMNARATHCALGHEFTGDNLRLRTDGGRGCRICRRDRSRAKRAEGKGYYFKTKICPICGGEFQQKQQGTRPKTCGRRCGGILQSQTRRKTRIG